MDVCTGYILGDSSLLSKLSANQKNNTYWTVVYFKKGLGMYMLDSSFRCLNDGDLIFLPPHTDFSFDAKDLGDEYNVNVEAVVLRFDKEWMNSLLAVFPAASETVLKVKELKIPFIVKGLKWMKMSSVLDGLLSCRVAEQPVKVLELLLLLSTDEDHVYIKDVPGGGEILSLSEKKEKIDRYLESNYCNKVSLEGVARYLGMSRTYFSLFFKTHYGEGFSDHLTGLRVKKAGRLLLDSDKQIPAIATECGFKTVQYFTRAFKKVTGVTPASYRRNNR